MKPLLILSAMTILTTSAQTTTDEQQIRQLVQTLEDGWTKKDGNHFAKPFAEDADYVVVNGMQLKGKEAIAKAHQQIFDSFYKETNIKTEVQSVRFLRPDVAIVHVNGQMNGVSYGKPVDTKAKISLVVEKTDAGVWQIAAFQNTQVTIPPAPANN